VRTTKTIRPLLWSERLEVLVCVGRTVYRRRGTDLPLSGRIVELLVIARRFCCDAVLCGRQIFTELLEPLCNSLNGTVTAMRCVRVEYKSATQSDIVFWLSH
jgi:hypothetical protein